MSRNNQNRNSSPAVESANPLDEAMSFADDIVADAPLSLDEDVAEIDATPAKDNDGIPYCRTHHCRMKQTSGGKKDNPKIYYGCPVPGCKETHRLIRTDRPGVVPPQPQCCPRCTKDKPVYCERDPKASTPAMVILKCPSCGWKSTAFAVPQLAAAHFARRPERAAVNGIGDR